MLIFQNNTMKEICFHAQAEYPRECCGIMLGRRLDGHRITHKVIQVRNMIEEGQDATHFSINPLEIAEVELSAEKENLEIVGFYHSHPDYEATPSSEDMLYMIEGCSYPIVSVKNGICVKVNSFEKRMQTDIVAKEEDILVKEN